MQQSSPTVTARLPHQCCVPPDGQRFVMIEMDPLELRPLGLVIVPNWTAELQARMAAAGEPRRSNP